MILTIGAAAALCSCSQGEKKTQDTDFHYLLDEFADLKVIRFRVPGWDNLSLRQKEYAYHLSEAAKLGRDITWDQFFRDYATRQLSVQVMAAKEAEANGMGEDDDIRACNAQGLIL